jgi:hypothetical protein
MLTTYYEEKNPTRELNINITLRAVKLFMTLSMHIHIALS